MSIKSFLITVICTAIVTGIITYYISVESLFYDPLSDPEILKMKHETELRDSLNNKIIRALKQRIDDKQYIIDNILLQRVNESKNRIKNYSKKRDDAMEYINSLNEIQLQNDINSKLKNRRN